jgi:gentisate 1,2-dioxygenase
MEVGDLILTPHFTWHDHTNDSGEPIVWLDGLDMPLIVALNQVVIQDAPEPRQAIVADSGDVSAALYGPARPHTSSATPFFHYRWRDTEIALRALIAAGGPIDPYDGYLLEYRNPTTGGPTMPSIQCSVQLLPADHRTQARRHTSTKIYHALRGSGTTYVGDRRLDWDEGDTFVVPVWYAHRHVNTSSADEAILFSMSDTPVLQALDLYREEAVAEAD